VSVFAAPARPALTFLLSILPVRAQLFPGLLDVAVSPKPYSTWAEVLDGRRCDFTLRD
jgi:hypothetical protein